HYEQLRRRCRTIDDQARTHRQATACNQFDRVYSTFHYDALDLYAERRTNGQDWPAPPEHAGGDYRPSPEAVRIGRLRTRKPPASASSRPSSPGSPASPSARPGSVERYSYLSSS